MAHCASLRSVSYTQPRRRIADKAVARFKDRVRDLTRRHRGVSLERMIADLNPLLRGWAGYFGFSQLRELGSLDGWTRRRLRCGLGPVEDPRQTLQGTPSSEGLREGGQRGHLQPKGAVAVEFVERAASRLHQCPLQGSRVAVHGEAGERLIRRTAVVRTRMPGGVGGVASRDAPLSRSTAASTVLCSTSQEGALHLSAHRGFSTGHPPLDGG